MFVLETLLNDKSLVERKISNVMDVHRLIAEIQNRPALWDVRHGDHKARHCINKLWQEVAEEVGADVDQCKRKWKNLRDAYRAEVRRSQRRIERDKLTGDYDPNTNYNSKWAYFPSMSFISDNRLNSCYNIELENSSSNSNDNNQDDIMEHQHYNDSMYNDNFPNVCNIKQEPLHNDMEHKLHNLHDGSRLVDEGDDDTANDMLFEEFQNIATPQAARRLSETLSLNQSPEQHFPSTHDNRKSSTSTPHNCKCSQRTEDRVHFLEDLGKEEQKLMKSTRQDITRANKLDHVGDSDYNFLASFLPQMKKMSELQNLQFRAKMCEMVLNIMTPTTAVVEYSNANAMVPTTDASLQNTGNMQDSMNN
ncbi:Transcription factor Adf-1 [Lucilia cuprina]|nr:Transcription factor Adf-1 [Lucilia cuprina]